MPCARAQILAAKLEDPEEEEVWLHGCGASFAAMIRDKQSREALEAKATVGVRSSCACTLKREHAMCLVVGNSPATSARTCVGQGMQKIATLVLLPVVLRVFRCTCCFRSA